jgi:hypothetical protein
MKTSSLVGAIAGVAVLAGGAAVAPSSAAAQTNEPTLTSLQSMIESLQEEVDTLQDTVEELRERVSEQSQDTENSVAEAESEMEMDETDDDGEAERFEEILFKGKRGPAVERLQEILKTDEELYDGPVTGYFGPQTEQALRQFQQQEGLPETGILDGPAKDTINDIVMNGAGQSGIIPPGLLKQHDDEDTLEESDASLPPGLQRGNGRGPFGGGDDEEGESEEDDDDDDEEEEGNDDDETATSTDNT